MNTYRMIVNTQTSDRMGRTIKHGEIIRHIPEDEVADRRNAARLSAPLGSTRVIQVVKEI